MSLQEALVSVGILCVLAGTGLRGRGETSRGLSIALIVVGVVCVILGPAGRRFGVW